MSRLVKDEQRRQQVKINLISWGRQYDLGKKLRVRGAAAPSDPTVALEHPVSGETKSAGVRTSADVRSCGRWRTNFRVGCILWDGWTKESLRRRSDGMVSRRRCWRSLEKWIKWIGWIWHVSTLSRWTFWKVIRRSWWVKTWSRRAWWMGKFVKNFVMDA